MKSIQKKIVVIKDKGFELEKQIIDKTLGYIVASFSLVAGLAWNEAIKGAIETFFPLQQDTVKAKFIYAIVITAVVVFVSLYVVRLFKREEELKKEEVGIDMREKSVKSKKK